MRNANVQNSRLYGFKLEHVNIKDIKIDAQTLINIVNDSAEDLTNILVTPQDVAEKAFENLKLLWPHLSPHEQIKFSLFLNSIENIYTNKERESAGTQ